MKHNRTVSLDPGDLPGSEHGEVRSEVTRASCAGN
jgi:hypothetical protein